MDDSFYASLLDDSNDGNNNNDATQPPVVLSVILCRKSKTLQSSSNSSSSSSVRLAVAARIPRKRMDCTDPIQHTIQYYSFLDDRRRFTNLDALLTRLSPVGVVHLSCTESAEVHSQNPTKNQIKKAREVSNALQKLSAVIDSRTDILPQGSEETNLTSVERTLPKNISNTTTLSQQLESNLRSLLGADNSNDDGDNDNGGENNSGSGSGASRFQQYKNDTKLMDDMLAQQAIAFLLLSENITAEDDENGNGNGSYELVPGDLTSQLTMDRTAMECINLLPPRHAGISNVVVGGSASTNSIFGVLNQCKTKMGVRMLELWLRQPSVCLKTIMYRQNAVKVMVEEDGLGRDRVRDEGLGGLRGVDLDSLCGRLNLFGGGPGAEGGTSKALECLYRLHLFADRQLPILMESLADLAKVDPDANVDTNADADIDADKSKDALSSIYAGLDRVMVELSKSVQLVDAVLDFDAAPREFLVKASFSEELGEIREELDAIEQERDEIHAHMNQIWEELSGKRGQVKLEDTDSSSSNDKGSSCAWQFRLLDTNASKVLQQELKDDVTVHRLLKNGVYFSTKELRELGSKKHDLLLEYDKNQREIVQNAMSVAVTYIPVLERASELIAEIDVLASLANVAAFNPHGYCCPEMTDSEEDGAGIVLVGARHPCVELQDNVDFIPNDFKLVHGESSFLLVTGPNMGGKSTYIRSLGAIITMAQIGSYVPATTAKMNIVHHLLARVGAGDVQDRGISTFMAEMLEASSIIRTATKRSLIIIDELGRGTSTFDGYGLARAISEHIVQKIGCTTVFATHFHELTAMEESEKVVKNCHVTAKRATDGTNGLSFLYEVQEGPCLESFGIQVAEMANVPAVVVRDAKRKATELENFDYKRRKTAINDCSKSDALAKLFVEKFKAIPLKSFATEEEKRNAVLSLLQQQ